MRFWLLILASWANAVDVGSISELRGNGEVIRQGSTDKVLAEMALDIFSLDDVRTGNGRIAIEFLDSSVVRLTEHSKLVGSAVWDQERKHFYQDTQRHDWNTRNGFYDNRR